MKVSVPSICALELWKTLSIGLPWRSRAQRSSQGPEMQASTEILPEFLDLDAILEHQNTSGVPRGTILQITGFPCNLGVPRPCPWGGGGGTAKWPVIFTRITVMITVVALLMTTASLLEYLTTL